MVMTVMPSLALGLDALGGLGSLVPSRFIVYIRDASFTECGGPEAERNTAVTNEG
jgi:hypothetical protein